MCRRPCHDRRTVEDLGMQAMEMDKKYNLSSASQRALGIARPGVGHAHASYRVLKRALDLILTCLALLLLAPLLALIALGIALEDGGPVLFSQVRVGKHGRSFRFLKFRSMVRNAEALKDRLAAQNEACGPIFKIRDDPRVTRIGRWLRKSSLDELPQLFNV